MKVNPKLFVAPQLKRNESVKDSTKDEKSVVKESPKEESNPKKIDCSISDIVAKLQETAPAKINKKLTEYDELKRQFEIEYKRVIGADFEGAKMAVQNLIKLAETLRGMAPEEEKQYWEETIKELQAYLINNFPEEPTHRSEETKSAEIRNVEFTSHKKRYQEYLEKRNDFLTKIEQYKQQAGMKFINSDKITPDELISMANELLSLINDIDKLLEANKYGAAGARQEIYDALMSVGIAIKG